MSKFKVETDSTFESVDSVITQASGFFRENGNFGIESSLFFLCFALRELLINAVEHGNRMQKDKRLLCEIICSRQEILFEITDEGEGFSLSGTDAADVVCSISDRGRGICMIRKLGFHLSVNGNKVSAAFRMP